MQDHYLIEEDGSRIAISDLPLHTIHELLHSGVEVTEGDTITAEQFMDRLRIELVVRTIIL